VDCNSMNRKEFFVLTFMLIGSAVAGAAACSSSTNNSDGGASGSGGGAGGSAGGNSTCADPLPEMQVADQTGHTHTVTVAAATLNATTDQTFTTSAAGADGHTHMITLAVANLAAIKAGGSGMVTSTTTDAHSHMFVVSCQAA
jgi:hypothetical protein